MKKITALSLTALMLGACAQNVGGRYQYTPVVDIKASGKSQEQYLVDLDQCQQLAAQRDGTSDAVAGAVAGALLGAALGGLTGSMYGQPQTGAAYGAGYGAIGGGVGAAAEGHANQRGIVQRCLAGRGYRVVGH